jgi:hypothetical protein
MGAGSGLLLQRCHVTSGELTWMEVHELSSSGRHVLGRSHKSDKIHDIVQLQNGVSN